ncbi:MAG: CinA family protein [Desulfocurvibacter africanus]
MLEIEQTILGLGSALKTRGLMLATAESCTGGLIAGALTEVSGSSDWFRGGVVAYANVVKIKLLSVPQETLLTHGAVSEAVVLAMARGALDALDAQVAVAVSGVAGPTGGSPDKPVGTVWIAWAWPGGEQAVRYLFPGDRETVRRATVEQAVKGLAERIGRSTVLA